MGVGVSGCGYLYLAPSTKNAKGCTNVHMYLGTAATLDKISQQSKTATHIHLQPRFMLVWIQLSVDILPRRHANQIIPICFIAFYFWIFVSHNSRLSTSKFSRLGIGRREEKNFLP